MIVMIFAAIAFRFIHIEADFPQGITWSGVLYTDEGWYSNGATSYVLTGNWYIEGDFNPAINLPIFQLIQSVIFNITGVNLSSARITVIVFSIFIILGIYIVVRKFYDSKIALVAALLWSGNFMVYAYSRLAILEIPMTCLALLSLLLASSISRKNFLTITILSAITFVLAMLTKTTAVFVFPILLYCFWNNNLVLKEKLYAGLIFSGCSITLLLIYNILAMSMYHSDYTFFTSLNIASRISLEPLFVLKNIRRIISHGRVIDSIMYPLTVVCLPIFWVCVYRSSKNKLLTIQLWWLITYVLMLSVSEYDPPRYYLPLTIPIVILFSVMFVSFYRVMRYSSSWSYFSLFMVGVIVFNNLFHIISYLYSPQYSFLNMCQDIRGRVAPKSDQRVVLLGHLANSISLVTEIPSINTVYGTQDLRWKLFRYKPTYYVSLGIEEKVIKVIKETYDMKQLSTYDVFNNYYGGQKVYFYEIIKQEAK